MIKNIKLKNFTVFNQLEVNFSPKINIIIAENGTGKSHLLKALYALCCGCNLVNNTQNNDKISKDLTSRFLNIFMPLDNKLNKLRKNGSHEDSILEALFSKDEKIALKFNSKSKNLDIQENQNCENYSANPIFIPTKEVLSLIKGIISSNSDPNTIRSLFDDTYLDLCNNLIKIDKSFEEDSLNFDPRFGTIFSKMVDVIGGKYEFKNQNFYFQCGEIEEKTISKANKTAYIDIKREQFKPCKGFDISNNMTAEGFRKIGVLQQLLANKTLNPGISGPLFWDEPESNMNPKLVKLLVSLLLELSRNGQQIIIATHDYVVLKWFDLLMDKSKGDHIFFHSLYRNTETKEVLIETADTYQKLNNNAIASTFADLYDNEIDRALGGQDK